MAKRIEVLSMYRSTIQTKQAQPMSHRWSQAISRGSFAVSTSGLLKRKLGYSRDAD